MAKETVRFDMGGIHGLMRDLERGGADVARAHPAIAEALVTQVNRVFEEEGAVGGNPRWPPLAASTLAKRRPMAKKRKGAKRRKAKPGPNKVTILQDTGRLAGSITPDAGDTWVEAYTNVKYAKFHVSQAPRKIIPLRDFFAIDEEAFIEDATDMLVMVMVGRV